MPESLKLSSFIAIIFLVQITFANAGKVHINNINIPNYTRVSQMDGKLIKASIKFTTDYGLYFELDVPDKGNAEIYPLEKDRYSIITLNIWDMNKASYESGARLMTQECFQYGKPIIMTENEDDVLGISVSYQPEMKRVTCDITTPHKE